MNIQKMKMEISIFIIISYYTNLYIDKAKINNYTKTSIWSESEKKPNLSPIKVISFGVILKIYFGTNWLSFIVIEF